MNVGNNVPEPLLDIRDYLPDGITPEQNGIIPVTQMKKVSCGGYLYIDATRSWNAMERAAFLDGVFLNLNHPLNTYKDIIQQRKLFQERFEPIDPQTAPSSDAVRVEFDDKIWQLKTGRQYVECPGQMSHGFGLAVFINNESESTVREWLTDNAGDFGFVREYKFLPGRFVYVRGKEAIPERVLEIENLPPEPRYSAESIVKHTGCQWHKQTPEGWNCNGMFVAEPYRTGALAVLDQGSGIGLNIKSINSIFRQCAGIICTNPINALIKLNRPLLISTDIRDTIEKLSEFFMSESSEETPTVVTEQELKLQSDLKFYKMINPETTIFQRKKILAQRLLEISVEDLKSAPDQPWYREYHALLQIRLKNPILRSLAQKFVGELMRWYESHSRTNERELALLGIVQFIEPTELKVPLNQNFWHKEMITDFQGVFLHQYTRIGYTDEDIVTYYLAQQKMWRHGKRKMRVAFLIHSSSRGEKLLPIYDLLRERDDVEPMLVLHPSADHRHSTENWKYFRARYPDDVIYDTASLLDLRKLKPDYVFYRTPYEFRRPFSTFTTNDIIQFAKLCNISYGATLAYTFIYRLMDDFPNFYRSMYFMFCSAATVKEKFSERYASNVEMGYQNVEFLGYPILDQDTAVPDPHSTVNILWTPRWNYKARVGGSHFLEYKDKFITLGERYGDKVKLSMRPHANTFREMQEKGLITKEELDAYKKSLKEKSIDLYSTQFDLYENFRRTDVLLGDYSSILIVYFLTGRPIIYCDFPNAVPLDEYKEMFDCMYVARSWDEVLHYLDELVAGNDPLYERRQKAVAKIRADHANAAQRIVDRLVEDFKRCEEKM